MAQKGGETEGGEEEEEKQEEGAEINRDQLEYQGPKVLEPGQTWPYHWKDEWDYGVPQVTLAYEKNTLTKETWLNIIQGSPTALATLPNKEETIVRVPQQVANSVADPAEELPPVEAKDIDKQVAQGVWHIKWGQYLEEHYRGSKYQPSTPNILPMSAYLREEGQYGPIQQGTPNNLGASGAPQYGQPWVPPTHYNVGYVDLSPLGSPWSSSPGSSRPSTAMSSVGAEETGPLAVRLFGAEKPTLSKGISKCAIALA